MASPRSTLTVRGLAWFALVLFCALPHASAATSNTEIHYLSGKGPSDAVLWDFFCTEGRNHGTWTKIRVPSCWEQEGFGTYVYGRSDSTPPNSTETGKYRTTFRADPAWSGRVVRLVFEGAMTDTEVWVNGKAAGPMHQGGFYQFKYDVTPLLKAEGENVVEVSVRRDSANESIDRAERWGDYWNFSGIYRPVYLEVLPAKFIDRVAIDAKATGTLDLDVFFPAALGEGFRVSAEVQDRSGHSTGTRLSTNISADANRVHLSGKAESPALWTAETPNLYQLLITLESSAGVVHTITQRFGFRTIEVRPGDGFYLNRKKIVLKGANRHSFWPETGRALDPEQSYADIRLMQEMNMNAVRMSHYPPDQHFLDACDELGLYVLDEIAGWQNSYDTPTGKRIIGETVRRDVNHPSILFWDNGNEGGWNRENDDEFAQWDPQHRQVLHPWELFRGVTTRHYRKYPEHLELLKGPNIYMPTEFLHGLYDGGIGAGMLDYWTAMRSSPYSAGGFFWALVDEGVARSDKNGKIDNFGNSAPDGIVGPHREKEGSFFTVKELWSPVQIIVGDALPNDFDGLFPVENNYAFTSLDRCRFVATLANFAPLPKTHLTPPTVVWTQELGGAAVAPGAKGSVKFQLPTAWRDADLLTLSAHDPNGRELWTWSWLLQSPEKAAARFFGDRSGAEPPKLTREAADATITTGDLQLRFNGATGELVSVKKGKRELALTAGPRLAVYRRNGRGFDDIAPTAKLIRFDARVEGTTALVDATYDGALKTVRWTIAANGLVRMDYEYAFDGTIDLLGVHFSLPEVTATNIRWLGKGPYRVWQNRLNGTQYGVWENENYNSIPGEVYHYPEYPGYFRDWRWARIGTTDGPISIATLREGQFLGLLKPFDGHAGLYSLPNIGLAILDVIPAMRNKFHLAEETGPQGQPAKVSGARRGSVQFTFD